MCIRDSYGVVRSATRGLTMKYSKVGSITVTPIQNWMLRHCALLMKIFEIMYMYCISGQLKAMLIVCISAFVDSIKQKNRERAYVQQTSKPPTTASYSQFFIAAVSKYSDGLR